ncbi:hypothetical protein [Acidipropionibacterium jensenii]|uniref:hypothetical protein n=1 Tax=Acidipropionibacterium jensenii TaxID=1749 RepID=UPI000BC35E2A|nr:hypothetical protein [Acidipropionibacterium jensenii]
MSVRPKIRLGQLRHVQRAVGLFIQKSARWVFFGALACSAWIFQVVQSWVGAVGQVPREALIWILPALASGAYLLLVTLVAAIVRLTTVTHRKGALGFQAATINYARQLSKEGADRALVELRRGVSMILHTQNANSARVQLGEIALDSAIRAGDRGEQLSILIDDLGWANHMAGHSPMALRNIQLAIDSLDEAKDSSQERLLLRVKAMRHKGIIQSHSNLNAGLATLKEARSLLNQMNPGREKNIQMAQILHAEGLAVATNYGIMNGAILENDVEPDQLRVVQGALESTREAITLFEDSKSSSRLAKARHLETELLHALRKDQAWRMSKVAEQKSLQEAAWQDGTINLNG